jgi:hypothetical protein
VPRKIIPYVEALKDPKDFAAKVALIRACPLLSVEELLHCQQLRVLNLFDDYTPKAVTDEDYWTSHFLA